MRPVFEWQIGSHALQLGKRTLIMGVVNVTPDSFSDGGPHLDPEAAVAHALQLVADGADIIDIGGESTRPGASVSASAEASASPNSGTKVAVSEREELDRVIPIITSLRRKRSEVVISVDTYKSAVARAAVEAGAEIVNDVSGFEWDREMKKTLVRLTCGVVLMHARGRPDEWHSLAAGADLVVLVKRELRERADAAMLAGVKRDRIVLDPGFGFGKRFEENYPLLRRFDEFHELRFPLLAGVSRKSFIARALAQNGKEPAVPDRLFGTLGAEVTLIFKGAHLIRTHNVQACVEAAKLVDLVAS